MKRGSVVWLVVLVACEKTSTPLELASPVDAAKCQRDAIKQRSTARWRECMHPMVRDDRSIEKLETKARRDEFWELAERQSAALDNVREADFTFGPTGTNDDKIGDSAARFKLEKDSFEVVRKDGRWYIVDTGI